VHLVPHRCRARGASWIVFRLREQGTVTSVTSNIDGSTDVPEKELKKLQS